MLYVHTFVLPLGETLRRLCLTAGPTVLLCIVAVLGCASKQVALSSDVVSGVDRNALELVRVVGNAIRDLQHTPPPVGEGLADKTGASVSDASPTTTRALASVLASSIGVGLLDSVSARQGYYKLIAVGVTPDSGWVDVFERPSSLAGESYFFSSVRWLCMRVNGRWGKPSRKLLLAA